MPKHDPKHDTKRDDTQNAQDAQDAQDFDSLRCIGETSTRWASEAFTATDGTTVYLYWLVDMPHITVVADSDQEFMQWLRILINRFLPPVVRARLVSAEAEGAEGAKAVTVNTRPSKDVH